MRAVIHTDQGHRGRACLIAGIHHGADHAHGMDSLIWTVLHIKCGRSSQFALHVAQRISLFRDGEGSHLQAGLDKDRLECIPLSGILAVGADTAGNG